MRVLLAVIAIISVGDLALAGQFGCPSCQSCGGRCVLTVEQVDGEEECYDLECEEICIPAVRFPWESCRTPKCGRTRVVAKLKEDKRETKACEYKRVIVCDRCGRPAALATEDSKKQSVPPAPKDAPKPEKKLEDSKPGSAPMPPAAPPAAWVPPQPPGFEMVPSSRPLITPRPSLSGYSTPRPSLSGYSVRSSTR